MRKIVNVELSTEVGEENISLPKDALWLTAQMQLNKLVMWFIMDLDVEREQRTFIVLPTEVAIDYDLSKITYITTVQTNGGFNVLHIFEKNSK